jgi:hypothetical protein
MMRRTLVCILAGLILTQPVRAQDDTNARLITDGTVWAQLMQQVMGGTSLTVSSSTTILGPAGIYANVQLHPLIAQARMACESLPPPPSGRIRICLNPYLGQFLTNYFGYLLENPAVSGLLIEAQWQDLQPNDPGPNPSAPSNPDSTVFNYLDAAFNAITVWNKEHSTNPKTLQLELTPGFNSPTWLFDEIDTAAGGSGMGSCDGLFYSPPQAVSSKCGYTNIFWKTESPPPAQLPFPLPWNPAYKQYWRAFLTAVSNYIYIANPDYVSSFVSIAVAGPTASSTEIILPHSSDENAGTLTLPKSVCNGTSCTPAVVPDVYHAWNALLGNSYGATSSYVNSERAFIEEWAYAIDVYGQLFSSVTLTVATGGDQLPDFPSPSNPFLTHPPLAFVPDCGTSNIATMSCAAETAILAYFAGPPVGGANAKATQENGLTARGIKNASLSGASVKWLSNSTTFPLSALNPSSGNSSIVSHMLAGLQLAKAFSDETPDSSTGYSPMQYEGCLSTPPCPMQTPKLTKTNPSAREQALLNVLQAFFQGTSAASDFGAAPTAMNGTQTVQNAPINYLQIWDTDILYAEGLSKCGGNNRWEIMLQAPAYMPLPAGIPAGWSCYTPMTQIVTAPDGKMYTAQQLLEWASYEILHTTQEPVTYRICPCNPNYPVPRNAFLGDAVCVTKTEQMQANSDLMNALNPPSTSTYSTDYTAPPVSPYTAPTQSIPYGVCESKKPLFESLVYRQAYMGDYVCVSLSQQTQVANDNAAFPTRLQFCPGVVPLPRQFPPLPGLPGLPQPGFPLPVPPGPLIAPQ